MKIRFRASFYSKIKARRPGTLWERIIGPEPISGKGFEHYDLEADDIYGWLDDKWMDMPKVIALLEEKSVSELVKIISDESEAWGYFNSECEEDSYDWFCEQRGCFTEQIGPDGCAEYVYMDEDDDYDQSALFEAEDEDECAAEDDWSRPGWRRFILGSSVEIPGRDIPKEYSDVTINRWGGYASGAFYPKPPVISNIEVLEVKFRDDGKEIGWDELLERYSTPSDKKKDG